MGNGPFGLHRFIEACYQFRTDNGLTRSSLSRGSRSEFQFMVADEALTCQEPNQQSHDLEAQLESKLNIARFAGGENPANRRCLDVRDRRRFSSHQPTPAAANTSARITAAME